MDFDLLKRVSRSFYLTLRVLPKGLREPVGLAYLLARAADTIADTALISPEQRLRLLLSFRAQVNGPAQESALREIETAVAQQQEDSSERVLLQSLPPAFAWLQALPENDRAEVRKIVTTLSTGMELDLRTFPLETSGGLAALEKPADLDHYIYLVAGCVGEFWTKMTVAHTPALRGWNPEEMSAQGVRFGKALQMTNVLRDCPKDLAIGRCYIPREILAAHNLKPEELRAKENKPRAQPVLRELLSVALDHYAEALRYTTAIPRRCVRLRIACLLPVIIGLKTLLKLSRAENWLDSAKRVKISRGEVYRIILFSGVISGSNSAINSRGQRLIGEVRNSFRV